MTSTIYRPRPSFWKLLKAAYYQRFAPNKLHHVRFVKAEVLQLPDGSRICLEVPTQMRPSGETSPSPLPMPGPGVVVYQDPNSIPNLFSGFDADFAMADEVVDAQRKRDENERLARLNAQVEELLANAKKVDQASAQHAVETLTASSTTTE